MDQQDAASGREEIYERVKSAYTQNDWVYYRNSSSCRHLILNDEGCSMDTESPDMEPGIEEGGSRDTKSPAIEPAWEKQSPMVNGSVEKPLEVNIERIDQPRSPMIEREEEVKCLEQNGKQSPGKEGSKSVEGDRS